MYFISNVSCELIEFQLRQLRDFPQVTHPGNVGSYAHTRVPDTEAEACKQHFDKDTALPSLPRIQVRSEFNFAFCPRKSMS